MKRLATKAASVALPGGPRASCVQKLATGQRRASKRYDKQCPTKVRVSFWTLLAEGSLTVGIANLRLFSEANLRENWRAKYQRKCAQQELVRAAFRTVRIWDHVDLPLVITIVRVGPKDLDTDNLAISGKACRDQIAKELQMDDGDKRLTWVYEQRRPKVGEAKYAVVIRIENGGVQ